MTLLSDIYDVTLKRGNREAAKGGFVRPTVGEHFMTNKDFKKVEKQLILIGYTQDLCTDSVENSTASSNYPDRGANKAFDNLLTGYLNQWQSVGNVTFPQWISYDFSTNEEKCIIKYTVQASAVSHLLHNPKDWVFEGSHNGITWDTLDTQTDQTNWGYSEKREFTFDNTINYRYYRLYITNNNGEKYLIIGEIEMMEGIYE